MMSAPAIDPNDYLNEDGSGLSFGRLLKMMRGQFFLPIAIFLTVILKVVSKLSGGRMAAVNAAARENRPVDPSTMPALGRQVFQAMANQLPEFRFVRFFKRDTIGMRQEYSAVGLHSGGQVLAVCEWQQHMIVLPPDKVSPEREKSTEASTIEFVSFAGDLPVVTGSVPREHMGAVGLYGDDVADIVMISNERRLEEILTEHRRRIGGRNVAVMNEEGAVRLAHGYGIRVRDHFLGLGLLRPITEAELDKIQKGAERHAARFRRYTAV